MIGLLILVIGLAGQWLLGVFIAQKVLTYRRHLTPTLAELSGPGCAVGIGATAWSLFLWSFCGGPLGILPSLVLTVIGYLTGGPILLLRLRAARTECPALLALSNVERHEWAVCRACQALIAFLFVACVLQTLQTPQKLWDERAIFAIKAEVLFEDRSIRSPALVHPDFVQYHPRYPLLLPLAEEHIYALLGFVDDRLSKIVFSLLYLGLVLATAGVLQRHVVRARAWLGALILATIPVLMPYEYGFLCGQADAPVACYHGLSVLYLWDGLRRQKRGDNSSGSVLMAGICGGMGAFTKDEGIAYLMIDAMILGLFTLGSLRSLTQFRTLLRAVAMFVITAGSMLVPWLMHRRTLPLTTEMNYFGRMTVPLFLGRLDTLSWAVPHLLRRMFWEWREWSLAWWLMLAAFVSRPLRAIELPQALLILDVLGALASLLVAGMLAPAQLDEHLGGSSHRFLMQISPVAVFFAVSMFYDDEEEVPSPSANAEAVS